MKPIFLQFSNLNSYEEEFSIDFESLAQGGIFGIFGPTGSGKSTILDAITLALYGEIPRYDKTSHFTFMNLASDIAHVVFRFEIGARQYEAVRRYKRNLKTKRAAITYCCLSELDGEILADRKEGEVNAAIISLVGLNYQDFTRSVFLPQGKFGEFIFLKNDERGKMLERLFDLEYFGKILQEKVKRGLDAARGRLDACLLQIGFYGDITTEGFEIEKNTLAALSEKVGRLEVQRQVFFQSREKYTALGAAYSRFKKLQEEQRELDGMLEQIEAAKLVLEAARRAEKLRLPIDGLKTLTVQLAQTRKNNELYETLAAESRAEAEKYEILHQEARRAMTEKYPELVKTEQELGGKMAALKEIAALDEERAALRLEWKEINQNLEKLELSRREKLGLAEGIQKTLAEIGVKKADLVVAPEVLRILHEGAVAEKELASCREKIKGLAKFAKEEERGAAAFLAETLNDGEPCPVCGSTSHPKPATGFESYGGNDKSRELAHCLARSKELEGLLEKATAANPVETSFAAALELIYAKNAKKLDLEAKEANLGAERDKIAAELGALAELVFPLKLRLEGILEKGREKAETVAAKRAVLGEHIDFDEVNQAMEGVKAQIATIILEDKTSEDLKNKYQKQEQEAVLRLTAGQERLTNTAEMFEYQQNLVAKGLLDAGFDGEEQAENALLSETEMDALDRRIDSFHKKSAELEHTATQLNQALSGEEDIDQIPAALEKARTDYGAADAALMESREAYAVLQGRIEKMEADLEVLARLEMEKKALETRYGIIDDISKLFRGNAFIKYLAARHLFFITSEATKRLKTMTGGRFAIECDEDTDFYVRDDFNGGVYRPPASLSGGETFIVSLCLALALSKKIQMKRNTALSFFFLDEGFGSLDRDSLDTVMDCLERLREENMAVGLITHVEELKHRIINKIELGGGKDGSGTNLQKPN